MKRLNILIGVVFFLAGLLIGLNKDINAGNKNLRSVSIYKMALSANKNHFKPSLPVLFASDVKRDFSKKPAGNF